MLSSEDKKALVWIDDEHDSPLAREREGVERAGIYLLEGRFHVAAHTSPAAARLRERGALHVADLSWARRNPAWGTAGSGSLYSFAGADFAALRPRDAVRAFRPSFHPN
ncbi:MAG: hypothetical protein JO040_06470 [Gemmatimonadetes bacterium]|nr:hypothetical protein [Gemmatimonadota bacterium]